MFAAAHALWPVVFVQWCSRLTPVAQVAESEVESVARSSRCRRSSLAAAAARHLAFHGDGLQSSWVAFWSVYFLMHKGKECVVVPIGAATLLVVACPTGIELQVAVWPLLHRPHVQGGLWTFENSFPKQQAGSLLAFPCGARYAQGATLVSPMACILPPRWRLVGRLGGVLVLVVVGSGYGSLTATTLATQAFPQSAT